MLAGSGAARTVGTRLIFCSVARDLWGWVSPSGASCGGLDPREVILWGTQGDDVEEEQEGKELGATCRCEFVGGCTCCSRTDGNLSWTS